MVSDNTTKYWLMKSEPDVFGIDHLKQEKTAPWDGVRNYQARNFMRDEMKKGDWVLFYHSNASPPGIAGIAKVWKESYPDFTQFDPKSPYFDSKSTIENPRWMMVDVKFVEKFKELIPLDKLKTEKKLQGMLVTKKGQRLSIQPVEKKHFLHLLKMADAKLKAS